MKNNNSPIKPLYPDVLGQITGGPRINMDALEVALGIYPGMAFINQPIELVTIMQNMVDQELQLKIAIRTPNTDRSGNVAVIEVARPSLSMTLGPGEVGVLRMPLIARAPTRPSKDFPVRVAIRYRVSEKAKPVRPPGGGAPSTVLSISPFKLQVLKEVDFIAHKWNESTDILTAHFSVAAKTLPNDPGKLIPSYEALWTQEGLKREIRLAQAQYDEALEIARPGATGDLYPAFTTVVEERFANRGMPLHPGEAMAIAKMMTYTVEDAPGREPDVIMEETLWFRALCQVLAANPELSDHLRSEIISQRVFDAVLYEAVLTGFKVLRGKVEEDLGNDSEQINYANRFMQWFSGHGEADLTYVYLPLVLGGTSVARIVRSHIGENPWYIADAMDEALTGRMDLMHGQNIVIFDMLEKLLEDYKAMLRARRTPRPEATQNQRVTLPRDIRQQLSSADNGQTKDSETSDEPESPKGPGGIRRLSDR
jgi:hypothetical protein